MPDPLDRLRAQIAAAADAIREGTDGGARMGVERPPKPELGDYSTNAAMLLAPGRGERPREVAELLRAELGARLGDEADRIEVAGPGFLNLFLADRWYRDAVDAALAAGSELAAGVPAAAERVTVEFVSANPTGPLTAAGGRHAAYGDSVARILALAGHDVGREFYVNDAGGQVRRFAESIAARMRREDPPDEGYAGEYVGELAAELADDGFEPTDVDALERAGVERMRESIAATLERFGVRFDTWFSERSLHESGAVEDTVAELRERGHVYESEGATWLRSSTLGDDKDRVLVRSGGEPTYFAADVAYHRDKLGRADRLIDVLGADHHGYVARMRAAIESLGGDPGRFEVVIMQLVHLMEGEERARMSKRRGEFATLDDLIDDIGVDAARFFMLQRSHDTTVDLDLELARRHSNENPVYYVQYAHARICSILRRAGVEDAGDLGAPDEAPGQLEPSERTLVKRLLELPGEVRGAAERRAPHRLCAYATSTAADFHAFYRDCKVVGAPRGTERSRIALCLATRATIARTLDLLGVSAPESM